MKIGILTKQNKDLGIGILLGILIPIIGSLLLKAVLGYFPKFSSFRVVSWSDILQNTALLSTFIQFGVLLNLILFFILKWKKELQIQMGVVLPTMLYILFAMLLKFYL